MACPPSDRTDRVLDEYLGVPVVGLEKEELATWLQQPVDSAEILGIQVVADDGGADDIIEALLR